MRIYVQTISGHRLPITCDDKKETLLDVKKTIQERYRFPAECQILHFNSKELSSERETIEELIKKSGVEVVGESVTFELTLKNTDKNLNLWGKELEEDDSEAMRDCMCKNLLYFSVFKRVIKKGVVEAMEAVPRHLFLYDDEQEEDEKLVLSYSYNRPMRASPSSVESSPEVIAAMLSLVKVETSMKICVFGIKGGYIQSLLSQMTNLGGLVVVFSSDDQSFEFVRKRTEEHNPLYCLQKWILTSNLDDITALNPFAPFDLIFFCGGVGEISEKFSKTLLAKGGQLIAPVGVGRMQKLTVLRRVDEEKFIKHVVKEWGVVFSQIK